MKEMELTSLPRETKNKSKSLLLLLISFFKKKLNRKFPVSLPNKKGK